MSVSHELRTPLTAIRGHVAALSEGLVEDAEARAHLARDRRRGDGAPLAPRRRRARPREARRAPVHGARRRRSTWSSSSSVRTRRSTRRRGGAGSTTAATLRAQPVLITDGDRVLQIITNLLSNAFRWTPDGGRIELGLDAGERQRSPCPSPTPARGSRPAERERIFRPFWSRDGGGTGLGLAIANELAQALGGRIELETDGRPKARRSSSCCRATRDAAPSRARVVELRPRRSRARAAFVSLRPRQWSKNLLLFAGIVFAAKLGDAARWARGGGDLRRVLRRVERGVSRQRPARRGGRPAHPVKRDRPIARGELPPERALVLAAVLAAACGRDRRRARVRVAALPARVRRASARVQPRAEAHRARRRRA